MGMMGKVSNIACMLSLANDDSSLRLEFSYYDYDFVQQHYHRLIELHGGC
jgi:hypothetical protein